MTLVIHRANSNAEEKAERVPVICRLDTADELTTYTAGGVLQRFAQDFMAETVGRQGAQAL